MEELKDRLLRKAYLYADAEAYRAGVEAALAAVQVGEGPSEAGPQRGDVDEDARVVLSMGR
jgi:hypothetical protein